MCNLGTKKGANLCNAVIYLWGFTPNPIRSIAPESIIVGALQT